MDIEKDLIRIQLSDPQLEIFVRHKQISYVAKSSEVSSEARQQGNQLYYKKGHSAKLHEDIFNFYSKSVAFAPDESEELALAYGNRSALLLHIKKYEECIQDINRALSIDISSFLKVKLLCRKVESLTAVGSSENQIAFDNVVKYFNEIPEKHKDKNCLISIINKAKSILDENKPKVIQKDEKKGKFIETLSKKEKADPFSSVKIKHSQKYGRHLVASRNIDVGEIIYVEKPYAVCSNIKIPYLYCSHCLALAWNGVPCKNCSWCIFCSEECKQEALNKYHDIECSVIPHIQGISENIVYNMQLSVRAMIMGIREAGGLSKFKTELELIDNCTDERSKGFSECGKFETNQFRSLYSLSYKISDEHLAENIQTTAITLSCIAKYTTFFENGDLKYQPFSDLIKNEEVLFLGALLLRLIKISCVNRFSVMNSVQICKHSTDPLKNLKKKCCSKGVCFATLSSLINNSCLPNASKCFTEDQKIVLYAVQPIEKNSQIFFSYLCNFYETPNNMDRKDMLKQHFYFTCDCVACDRNWPSLLNPAKKLQNDFLNAPRSYLENEFIQEYSESITAVHAKNGSYDYEKTISHLVKGIKKATKVLPQPCTIRCILIFTLDQIYEKLYGYNFKTFNTCIN